MVHLKYTFIIIYVYCPYDDIIVNDANFFREPRRQNPSLRSLPLDISQVLDIFIDNIVQDLLSILHNISQ